MIFKVIIACSCDHHHHHHQHHHMMMMLMMMMMRMMMMVMMMMTVTWKANEEQFADKNAAGSHRQQATCSVRRVCSTPVESFSRVPCV